MTKFFAILIVLMVATTAMAADCGTWTDGKECEENYCVWYTKKCVACDAVDRTLTCKRTPHCRWNKASRQCSQKLTGAPTNYPTQIPTAAPVMSPTPSPSWVYTVDCTKIGRKSVCRRQRHCTVENGSCCFIADPDASCAQRVTKKGCKRNGCKWDDSSNSCY